ncbi:bifunctional diguanylate cyclase/phosphodiesterase [Caulobacter sp. FWC2]|uniref:putative bifunctional diguanylate cyclase/phosphodiesterase n=1 Tax=Caulobacter sp. FWC2 TaxID=69664 RepID=UPI000C14AA9E|nr:EAL domain-containing protein [Caulobacter sp. FWC2]PIB93618.1 bifunctional diguanylate cyclase/phosphodiesterase [Caulobacter sp. FWC2]
MTRLEKKIAMPMAAITLAAVALLLCMVFIIAERVDKGALTHDEALVASGLRVKVVDMERSLVPQTLWDEAVRHVDNRYDPTWVRANIATFLIDQAGFDEIVVLDDADQLLLAQAGQNSLAPAEAQARVEAFAPVVARLRRLERNAPRPAGRKADDKLVSTAVSASATTRLGDDIYMTTAALVQPDFGTALIKGARAPVVVAATRMDAPFLSGFASQFLLTGVHLHRADAEREKGFAHVPLRGADGAVVATLGWSPPHPGGQLLRKTLPPLLLVLFALAALFVVLARRGRQAAENLVASEARAKHMALHDALTGLPNRSLFEERLHQAIDGLSRHGGQMAVLAIDLDRFKAVNDTYGHAAGDELIRAVACRLTSVCRTNETVARLGGDEFGVVAAQIDGRGAVALAERLVEALSGSLELSCGGIFVSGSVGVALIGADEAHVGSVEAARRADVALYRAKDEGRGRYCFFEADMDAALRVRRGLETDLRQAMQDGGVWLAYQPQVDAVGKIVGVEALARWTHPTRGAISPAAFVPLAEDCGLIDELGRLVMRRAFADSLRWKGLKVAVNVSALQMKQADFPRQVADLLEETGARAQGIELEITEGALLGDDETTHDAIERLREMGFSLALDDFGTGYSSLSYLRRYPIDKIKIDRSFITPLGEDKEAGAVVHAIVRLAKALHLSVIAEGVETNVQREQLKEIGCGQAQGFLFSAAVPADAIDALVADGGRVKLTTSA